MAAPSITIPELLEQFRGALLAVGEKFQSTSRASKPEASQHIVTAAQLGQLAEAISMDCTKGTLKPTDVPTIHPLLDGMERHFIHLMQAHDLLALTSSTSLLRVVTSIFAYVSRLTRFGELFCLNANCVLCTLLCEFRSEMVNSTVHLFDEIKRGTTAAKCAPVLGVVWAACNALKSITLDNKRAVLHDVAQVTCTMKDAVRELSETVEAAKPGPKENEDDFGSADLDGLSPATRALAVPVLQLMKTGCSLAGGLEKLFAPLGQGPEDIDCMEAALACVRALGKEIDEVACAIYECDEEDDGLKTVVTLATAFHGTCAKLVALLLGNPVLKGQPEALKRLEVTNGVLNQALAQCRIQP